MHSKESLPQARTTALFTTQAGDDLVVYDERTFRIHCLNFPAAFIWRRCDGKAGPHEVAKALAAASGLPPEPDLVRMTVQRLAEAGLLERERRSETRISRRQLLRALGILSAAAPLVTSLTAPAAAQAASCIPKGASCDTNPNGCCPGCHCINGNPSKCAGQC